MGQQVPIVDYLVLEPEPHLVAQACDACGARYLDRRNACAKCAGRSFHDVPLGTTGTLTSFSIVYRAAPGVPAPFASATVALDGGGIVKGNVVGVDPTPEQISLGMRVALATFVAGTDSQGTEAVAFGFAPVQKEAA